jgi:tetratricopeptide (TPR) repeat protein
MSRTRILTLILSLAASTGLLLAQSTNTKQPQVKSQKEAEAIMAMFQAPGPQERINAAMELITKFADTDFKATAFYLAAFSARDLGDADNMIVYSERALEADKQNYGAMLLLSQALAQRTREFDLDKEEKLGRAEKLARDAIEMVSTAPKPNPEATDEQWEAGKRDFMAQGYEALGMAALVKKDYGVCAENFGKAVEFSMQPDPAALVRQANCLRQAKKYDEALAAIDKALALPDVHPQVRNAATEEKILINKLKAAQ